MSIDLNDIAVFNEVIACGGFSAAARKLDLPASSVSRRVARLEEQLGFKLINRTTRQLGLTEAGRIYHEKTAPIARQVAEAARAVEETNTTPSGIVRVTAPPDDGGLVWRLLAGFVAKHPSVDLELIHTLEYLDLIQERIDVALRGGPAPDSTVFTAHKLVESRILLAASPGYLAARGTPSQVEDLEAHDCIAMDTWAPNAIRRLDSERGPVKLTLRNRVRVNRLETAQKAACAGYGIAPVLLLNCVHELETGQLVEVLQGCLPMSSPFWAIYPRGRKGSAAARALVAHILEVAGQLRAE